MRLGGALCCAAALATGACAGPSLLLLPDESGRPSGQIAVLPDDGTETVITDPLTQAKLSRGRTSTRTVAAVDPAYAQLLADLPPAPIGFVLRFEENSTTITAESRQVLPLIRDEAKRPGAEIEVIGHTDTEGDEDSNFVLSDRRAGEVVRILIESGFPEALLTKVGRGENDLLVRTGDNVANEANRRVEVIVR